MLLPLTSGQVVDTPISVVANEPHFITWTSIPHDQTEVGVLLTNEDGLLTQNLTLADNVSTSTGGSLINVPNVPAG